jgi:hypothetical protein
LLMKLRSNIEVMLAVVVLIGAVVALLAAAYELYFGGRIVVAEDRASVFNSEYAAAYEGALNRPPVPPLASIETGEPVAVIWDTGQVLPGFLLHASAPLRDTKPWRGHPLNQRCQIATSRSADGQLDIMF